LSKIKVRNIVNSFRCMFGHQSGKTLVETTMTEADTCREFVTPRLGRGRLGRCAARHRRAAHLHQRPHHRGGWQGAARQAEACRLPSLLPPRLPAGRRRSQGIGLPAETGVQQAREYAEILGLKFAYATNGHRIIEIDYTTGTEREVDRYATPDELFARLTAATQVPPKQRAASAGAVQPGLRQGAALLPADRHQPRDRGHPAG
jgi:type I restriction enzyme R subunit